MKNFTKGLVISAIAAVGSEMMNEPRKKRQTKKPIEMIPIVNREDPSFCHKCKTSSAFYDSKNRLICQRCGYSSHR